MGGRTRSSSSCSSSWVQGRCAVLGTVCCTWHSVLYLAQCAAGACLLAGSFVCSFWLHFVNYDKHRMAPCQKKLCASGGCTHKRQERVQLSGLHNYRLHTRIWLTSTCMAYKHKGCARAWLTSTFQCPHCNIRMQAWRAQLTPLQRTHASALRHTHASFAGTAQRSTHEGQRSRSPSGLMQSLSAHAVLQGSCSPSGHRGVHTRCYKQTRGGGLNTFPLRAAPQASMQAQDIAPYAHAEHV